MTYIGQKEIKSIEGTVVTFTDESQETFSERQLEYVVTDEPKDFNQQQELLLNNIMPEIFEVYREYDLMDVPNLVGGIYLVLDKHDVKKGDMEIINRAIIGQCKRIVEVLVDSYDNLFYEAMGKAFGTYREGSPFRNFDENIKISDMKRVKNTLLDS